MSYQPPPDLPAEFRLTLACCRWAYAGDSADAVKELAARADWARFLAACRRHRVQGLAWHALSGLRVPVPAPAELALAGDARSIVEQGLRSGHESARLLSAFKGRGVPLMFLKGLPLARLAYGNPFLKMSADIDLLVMPEDVASSAALLRQLGYRLETPRDAGALLRWHRLWKESIWSNGDGLVIELHSRVADQVDLLPEVTGSSPTKTVAITAGIDLPTLADEEQFAYLTVHGASSAWFRLKWITDFAAFLHSRAPAEIGALYERARQLGAGRAVDQALLLSHRLYALPIGQDLAERLRTPVGRWLAGAALGEMLGGEPGERVLGTGTIHLTQFLLQSGWRYKGRELWRQVRVAAGLY